MRRLRNEACNCCYPSTLFWNPFSQLTSEKLARFKVAEVRSHSGEFFFSWKRKEKEVSPLQSDQSRGGRGSVTQFWPFVEVAPFTVYMINGLNHNYGHTQDPLSLHRDLARSWWGGICPHDLYQAVQTLASPSGRASCECLRSRFRLEAWPSAQTSRYLEFWSGWPASQRRQERNRPASCVAGAPPSRPGEGSAPESRSPLPRAFLAAGGQQYCRVGGGEGRPAQPLRRWSSRPARLVAEEPQKRTSTAAEPTSACCFLGPPGLSFSFSGIHYPA